MTHRRVPAAPSLDECKHAPAYVGRKACLRALMVSESGLRNFEARSKDPLPRIKANTAQGEIVYEIRDLFEWYYRHRVRKDFGEDAKPGDGSGGTKSNNDQKNRLLRAQADAQEIKNAVARGELAPIQLLEDALSNLCGQISSILGAIPNKLRKRYSWLKASQLDEIANEIAKVQNAASEVRLSEPVEDSGESVDNTDDQPPDSSFPLGS